VSVFIADFKQNFRRVPIGTVALEVLFAFIGALTLGSGGIGLMNIMLVSLQQLTRELGGEKAAGRSSRPHLSVSRRSHGHTFAVRTAGIESHILVSWGVALYR